MNCESCVVSWKPLFLLCLSVGDVRLLLSIVLKIGWSKRLLLIVAWGWFALVHKKPIKPTRQEVQKNRASRSALLRCVIKSENWKIYIRMLLWKNLYISYLYCFLLVLSPHQYLLIPLRPLSTIFNHTKKWTNRHCFKCIFRWLFWAISNYHSIVETNET